MTRLLALLAAGLVGLSSSSALAVSSGPAQPAPISRLKLAATTPRMDGINVTSTVRLIPLSGIEAYSAIVRMNRIGPNGIPTAVGVPWIIKSATRLSVGEVGATCYPPRRHSARSYYVSVTAAVLLTTGRAASGTRYSISQQLPC